MYVPIYIYIHTDTHGYPHVYLATHVAKVNINIVGMNAFLFLMEFLHFGGEIPSLLHF